MKYNFLGCVPVLEILWFFIFNIQIVLKQCECNVDTVSQIKQVWVHFKVQLQVSADIFIFCSVCSLTFAPDEFIYYKIYKTFFQGPQTFSQLAQSIFSPVKY